VNAQAQLPEPGRGEIAARWLLLTAASLALAVALPLVFERMLIRNFDRLLPVLQLSFPLAVFLPGAAALLLRRLPAFPLRTALAWDSVTAPLALAPVAVLALPQVRGELEHWLGASLLALWLLRSGGLIAGLIAARTGNGIRWPAVALVTFACYAPLTPWTVATSTTDGDEPHLLLIAHSLWRDGDINLTNNYINRDFEPFFYGELQPQPWERVTADGGRYSNHPPVLPALLLPGYMAGGRLWATFEMTLAGVAMAALLFQLAKEMTGSVASALFAWVLGAFSFPLLINASQITPEMVAGPLLLLSALLLRRLRPDKHGHLAGLAVIACVFPAIKPRYLLLAGPIFFIALLRLRRQLTGRHSRRLAAFVLAVPALTGALLLANYLIYHNPLVTHRLDLLLLYDYLQPGRLWKGLAGSLLDQEFGALIYAPVYLLALIGLVEAGKVCQGDRRMILGLVLPYFVIIAMRPLNNGGPPPNRFFFTVLPLLSVFFAIYHHNRPGWRPDFWFKLLTLLSAAAALALLVEPTWRYNRGTGQAFVLAAAGARFDADIHRLFPSFFRPSSGTIPALGALAGLLGTVWIRQRIRNRTPRPSSPQPLITSVTRDWLSALSALLALAGLALWLAHRAPTRSLDERDRRVVAWSDAGVRASFYYPGGSGWLRVTASYAGGRQAGQLRALIDGQPVAEIALARGKELLYFASISPSAGEHLAQLDAMTGGIKIHEIRFVKPSPPARGLAQAIAKLAAWTARAGADDIAARMLQRAAELDPNAASPVACAASLAESAPPEEIAALIHRSLHWPTADIPPSRRLILAQALLDADPAASLVVLGDPGAIESIGQALLTAGEAELKLNRPEAALKRYEQALANDEGNRIALRGIAAAAEALNAPQRAAQALMAAARIEPLSAEDVNWLACMFAAAGDVDAAEAIRARLHVAPPIVIEGETMAALDPTFVFDGLGLHTNGEMTAAVHLAAGQKLIEIRAFATTSIGLWPRIRVSLDDSVIWDGEINSREYRVYAMEAGVGVGKHTVTIEFYNDYDSYMTAEGLNVVVDWLKISAVNDGGPGQI